MPTSTIYDSVPDFLEEEDYDEVEPATPAASPNVEIKEEAAPASKMKQTSPQPVETEPTTPPSDLRQTSHRGKCSPARLRRSLSRS